MTNEEERPVLRGKVSESVTFGVLNLWLKTALKAEQSVADDFFRACMGADLRWDYLTLYWQLRHNFGHNPVKDTFGIGFEGGIEDEVVNGVIHCQSLSSFSQLPGDDAFKAGFRSLCRKWDLLVEKVERQKQAQEATKQPEPIQPMPQPVPAPKPPEKAPETQPVPQWWICPSCDEHNPPLKEKCLKCKRPRPGTLPPIPEDAKPGQSLPVPVKNWKQQLAWIGTLCSMILGGWFLFGNFLPPGVAVVVKTVLQLIVGLFGG